MKIYVAIAMAILSSVAISARNAAEVFTSAPDNIVRLLPQSTRLDMVDYFSFGSSKPSTNSLSGEARVTQLSDKSITAQIDNSVSMQMVVLPQKSDTVFAVITTLSVPFDDSSIKFYSSDWKPLESPLFVLPTYKEWINADGLKKIKDIEIALPFFPIKAQFDPEASTLTLVNNSSEYLGVAASDFKGLLIDKKTFKVVPGKFIPLQ